MKFQQSILSIILNSHYLRCRVPLAEDFQGPILLKWTLKWNTVVVQTVQWHQKWFSLFWFVKYPSMAIWRKARFDMSETIQQWLNRLRFHPISRIGWNPGRKGQIPTIKNKYINIWLIDRYRMSHHHGHTDITSLTELLLAN